MAPFNKQAAHAADVADDTDQIRYSSLDDVLVDVEANEETPLINPDMAARMVPEKSFVRLVLVMSTALLFIIEVGSFILVPAMQAVMEDIICRNHYPDHIIGMIQHVDHRCKDNDVQKTLAMVRSWSLSAEMAIPLLGQIPYGIVADKYGRRIVLLLALIGSIVQICWSVFVLRFPDVFSIWAILYGNVALFIGGGGQMVGTMIFTILADVIPVAQRTTVFYALNAFVLILTVAINPVAAFLLKIDPWLPLWFGFTALWLSLIPCYFMPETLDLRQRADAVHRHERETSRGSLEDSEVPRKKHTVLGQAWFTAKNDMSHVWRFIVADKNVLMLSVGYAMFISVKYVLSTDILQYMTKRFEWSWSKATYISTIGSLSALVTLLVVLPTASHILTSRFGFGTLSRDLLLLRVSIVAMTIGTFFAAVSAKPWQLITSLVLFSLGSGFSAQSRALINAIVEPHTVATANTILSLLETLMMMFASPVMGWVLSRGMDIGGIWMGLPFMVTFVISLIVVVILFVFRIPKAAQMAA